MSLRWRFALLFAGGAVLATALAAGAAFVAASRILYSEIDSHLAERAALAASFPFVEELKHIDFHDPVELEVREKIGGREADKKEYWSQELWKDLFGADSVFQWSDLDSGRPLLFMGRSPLLPVRDPAPRRSQRFDTVMIGGDPYRMLTIRVTRGSVIQIARNVSGQEEVLALLGVRFLLIGLLVAAAAGGGGWLAARRVTRPVEILTEAAAEVAKTRELLEPIDTGAAGEVGRLTDSFNSMIAALRDSRARQRRLIQDASHELRTPLASLRTNIEVLKRAEELEPEERRRLLADVHHELKELTVLVNELVDLASEQSRRAPDEPARNLDLGQTARTAAERASRRTQREVRVTGEGASLEARPEALQRAVDNLVDNALKWGPPGRPVEIALSGGELTVRDRGPGIPEDDLPYVFDRFYRAAEARSKPGSGLGLSIVKEIVESHGGRVHAANHPGGGALVGFTLPV